MLPVFDFPENFSISSTYVELRLSTKKCYSFEYRISTCFTLKKGQIFRINLNYITVYRFLSLLFSTISCAEKKQHLELETSCCSK